VNHFKNGGILTGAESKRLFIIKSSIALESALKTVKVMSYHFFYKMRSHVVKSREVKHANSR
jgi:hypothetical protein